MKKRTLALLLGVVMAFGLAACGGGESAPAEDPAEETILNLEGEWKQVNSASEDSYQIATIGGDEITVYWFDATTDTKSLYWAGTYVAPTEPGDTYSWESANDTEQTSMALMASPDEIKEFTYKDGQLQYDVSMMGSTQTVKLEMNEQ